MNKKYLELLEEMIVTHNRNEKDEFLNKLYIVCHLANWNCKNPHNDWEREVEKLCLEYNIK